MVRYNEQEVQPVPEPGPQTSLRQGGVHHRLASGQITACALRAWQTGAPPRAGTFSALFRISEIALPLQRAVGRRAASGASAMLCFGVIYSGSSPRRRGPGVFGRAAAPGARRRHQASCSAWRRASSARSAFGSGFRRAWPLRLCGQRGDIGGGLRLPIGRRERIFEALTSPPAFVSQAWSDKRSEDDLAHLRCAAVSWGPLPSFGYLIGLTASRNMTCGYCWRYSGTQP